MSSIRFPTCWSAWDSTSTTAGPSTHRRCRMGGMSSVTTTGRTSAWSPSNSTPTFSVWARCALPSPSGSETKNITHNTAGIRAGPAGGASNPGRSTEQRENEVPGKVDHEMKYENLGFETEGCVAVVTLNRPNRRNALSLGLMRELLECVTRIGEERQLRVVILAAAGKVYSSGHDLSELVGRDISDYRQIFDVCAELMTRIQSIPQPVIAEVQGIATAAG